MLALTKVIILGAVLTATQAAISQEKQSTCHALVMSGGGNKGSYEVGVIHGLTHLLNPEDVTYDVVTGVSAGAINTLAISLWPIGQEKEMSEWFVDLSLNQTSDQVFKQWPGGYLQGLLFESGILNDQPLLDYLTSILDASTGIHRRITIATVDVNTGVYVTYDETAPTKDLPTLVVASSSLPFLFPHRVYQDHVFMDGGTVWNTNLASAVNKCLEIVDDESQIIMDILMCDILSLPEEPNTGDGVANFDRYRSIKEYYKGMNDVLEIQRMHPDVQYRYFFMPSEPLADSKNILKVETAIIQANIDIGKKDAQKMVGLGHGHGFKKMREWSQSHSLQSEFKNFKDFLHQSTSE